MRPTAIVVDDHPSFRKMARRLLTAAGYDVVGEAADAAGAVTAASECHPAFVLLDVLLPGRQRGRRRRLDRRAVPP